MSDDMTMKDAVSAMQNANGRDALLTLQKQIMATLRAKAGQLASINGEIAALRQVCKLIDALTSENEVLTGEHAVSNALGAPPPLQSAVGKDRLKRLEAGKCTFRDQKSKKWCKCVLKSAAEKHHGYCVKHLNHLGLLKDKQSASAEE